MNNEKKEVRSIHYLGSKLRMLDAIETTLNEVVEKPGAICDLFSGSGTVSKYLLRNYDVISVDIQEYSKVLCEASTSYIDTEETASSLVERIKQHPQTNIIVDIFETLLGYEQECLKLANSGLVQQLYEIIELGSLYIYEHGKTGGLSCSLENAIKPCFCRINASKGISQEDIMICKYYGGLYFSYKQAVDMDCIAHWVFEQESVLKTKALAALLSTASDLVNTVGKQFAQPLKVRNAKGELKTSLLPKIQKDRNEDVYITYEKWLNYYLTIPFFVMITFQLWMR